MKTVRKFVFSCKGEQQLSASLPWRFDPLVCVKLFSLAAGVGAPAASFLPGAWTSGRRYITTAP